MSQPEAPLQTGPPEQSEATPLVSELCLSLCSLWRRADPGQAHSPMILTCSKAELDGKRLREALAVSQPPGPLLGTLAGSATPLHLDSLWLRAFLGSLQRLHKPSKAADAQRLLN